MNQPLEPAFIHESGVAGLGEAGGGGSSVPCATSNLQVLEFIRAEIDRAFLGTIPEVNQATRGSRIEVCLTQSKPKPKRPFIAESGQRLLRAGRDLEFPIIVVRGVGFRQHFKALRLSFQNKSNRNSQTLQTPTPALTPPK